MKKRLLPIILVILLLLCSCGQAKTDTTAQEGASVTTQEGNTPSVAEQMYEKYRTIIDSLEAEDYDGAIKSIESMKPAPSVYEVQITAENLTDYFEFDEIKQTDKDAYGNVYSVGIAYGYKLKDQFVAVIDDEHPASVEVGFIATVVDLYGQYDIDYNTLDYSGSTTNQSSHEENFALSWNPSESGKYYCGEHLFRGMFYGVYEQSHISYVDAFDVVRAEGSIYIQNNP